MKCKYCGCTDECACEGGCDWYAPRVCTSCIDKATKKDHQNKFVWVVETPAPAKKKNLRSSAKSAAKRMEVKDDRPDAKAISP